ncbi:hypothetical protein [Fibrobacter sp. UWEL]|uniref:hypothetical protein n=1 Tax=Fibrobacter sp. UWEL TaxID=1896209 RepID=UPI00091D0423|nr:hypothetical protein [Fibrobacter sp. UWEL]SHK53218.1 hypothetical protein SAMN05720468_10320 [Fibrobacter sp. UWEL]
MIRYLQALIITLLVIGLNGCTDSDKYVFEPDGLKDIAVEAYITRSFEQESERTKLDTIVPGDSIIFLTAIYPSKSIRLQRYYWNMDGKFFANEFSFKNTVNESGTHVITFILIDYFGDQITDSVILFVGNPPTLPSEDFFPRDNSQGINPTSPISFSWDCPQKDSLWQVAYHFTLTNAGDHELLVDTLLTEPYFTYYAGLQSQGKYEWSVSAINELNMVSREDIHATFYTEGSNTQGAVTGDVTFSLTSPTNVVDFVLQNTIDSTFYTIEDYTLTDEGSFFLRSIPEGTYSITCSNDSFPDFKTGTFEIDINSQNITDLSFILIDSISPHISHVDGKDTLNAADTLKFYVADGGGPLKLARITAQLEGSYLSGLQYQDTTLIVPLSLDNSWSYKLLKITAQDDSGNRGTSTFWIRPTSTFKEVYYD